MKKSENYKTDFVSRDYYSYLVELRQECNYLFISTQKENDPNIQEQFKWSLKLLVWEMKPKYLRRQDEDMPDALEKDVQNCTMRECEIILESINRLQEKLGITSKAREEYEKDLQGAEKKQEENSVEGVNT